MKPVAALKSSLLLWSLPRKVARYRCPSLLLNALDIFFRVRKQMTNDKAQNPSSPMQKWALVTFCKTALKQVSSHFIPPAKWKAGKRTYRPSFWYYIRPHGAYKWSTAGWHCAEEPHTVTFSHWLSISWLLSARKSQLWPYLWEKRKMLKTGYSIYSVIYFYIYYI